MDNNQATTPFYGNFYTPEVYKEDQRFERVTKIVGGIAFFWAAFIIILINMIMKEDRARDY